MTSHNVPTSDYLTYLANNIEQIGREHPSSSLSFLITVLEARYQSSLIRPYQHGAARFERESLPAPKFKYLPGPSFTYLPSTKPKYQPDTRFDQDKSTFVFADPTTNNF